MAEHRDEQGSAPAFRHLRALGTDPSSTPPLGDHRKPAQYPAIEGGGVMPRARRIASELHVSPYLYLHRWPGVIDNGSGHQPPTAVEGPRSATSPGE